MAEWKKIIVSGSQAELAGISGSGLTTNRLLTANAGGAIASSGITVSGNSIVATGASSALSGSFSGSFQGDGSGLTGVTAAVDIDSLDPLGGTGLHQTQDNFIFSDNGTEKKITFSNLEDAIFANISGDATVAAGGVLTISNDAVGTDEIAHSLGITGNPSNKSDKQFVDEYLEKIITYYPYVFPNLTYKLIMEKRFGKHKAVANSKLGYIPK